MTDVELIISAENSKELKIQGVSLKGDPGEPGYTPQRGIDYWTEEDKAEVVEEATEAAAEAVYDAIGDIDTALENIIAKYGLGGDVV